MSYGYERVEMRRVPVDSKDSAYIGYEGQSLMAWVSRAKNAEARLSGADAYGRQTTELWETRAKNAEARVYDLSLRLSKARELLREALDLVS